MVAESLFDKLWRVHRVEAVGEGMDLIAIDRHLLHDLSGPGSLKDLTERGLPVHSPRLTFATPGHGVSTVPGRTEEDSLSSRRFLPALRRYCRDLGIQLFDLDSPDQGIVHVIGPKLGLTLPGLSIVCGDSHTCTHGAFGTLAWGIGSTEITQVLATQALILERPLSMRVTFDGLTPPGVSAKDLILYLIGQHGAARGARHAVEFAGEAITALSMEDRMAVCNLAVEFGARFGFIAPDTKTLAWLKGRRFAPADQAWTAAAEHWRTLPSDPGARFDAELRLDVSRMSPQVTWGVSLDDVIGVEGTIPSPDDASDERAAAGWRKALDYMGLEPGARLAGTPIQHVFIGSCANSRLSDLQAAAEVVRDRHVANGVSAWVVPGSQAVKRAAEALGLDVIFREAGFSWRESGCSMCLAMNGDQIPRGERCVSTSNRNFAGRQGPGARTHLASPATAAASAIAGCITDPRTFA
jgi:3-isopropylmalate/(R)-2-methylmalate dehydratase large subunit